MSVLPAKTAGRRPGDPVELEAAVAAAEVAAEASREAACLKRAAAILLLWSRVQEREAVARSTKRAGRWLREGSVAHPREGSRPSRHGHIAHVCFPEKAAE